MSEVLPIAMKRLPTDLPQSGPAVRRASADLVRASRRGDRRAFGKLYEDHSRMVHAVLLSRVRSSEADDLMQDVFLSAMAKLDSLREDEAFGAWLAAIARRAAASFLRSSPMTTELPDELPGRPGQGPAERLEAERVLDRIRLLPEAYRETLLMRLAEGMSGPEIAERTGLSPGSVRVNLHRGMAMLRERLGAS